MLRSLWLVAVVLPMFGSASALPEVYVSISVNGNFEEEMGEYSRALEASNFAEPNPNDPTQLEFAYARTQSTMGMLSVQTYAQAEGFFGAASGIGNARFRDEITITHPDLSGQAGWFEARMRVSGTLFVAGYNITENPFTGFGEASIEATMGFLSTLGGSSTSLFGSRDSNGSFSGTEAGLMLLRVDFIYGQAFEVFAGLSATGSGTPSLNVGGGGVGIAGYGNSSLWLGIDALFDEGDNAVEGAMVLSASGVDYRLDFSENRVFRGDFEAGLPPAPEIP